MNTVLLERLRADDGTVKYLWELHAGVTVESVTLRVPERVASWHLGKTNSLDRVAAQRIAGVSSQAGCNVGCTFCATGMERARYNLTPGEIIAQVALVQADFPGEQIGVSFAGMGEPLLNYRSVVEAGRLLLRAGSITHVTISTSGIVPSILRLANEEDDFGLWISLHAPTDEVRTRLIPHNARFPIHELLAAAAHFADSKRAKVGVSYLLLAGINDSRDHAQRLCELLDPRLFNVQVLLWNSVPGLTLIRPSTAHGEDFVAWLLEGGQPAYLMESAGRPVDAGCGQLTRRRPVEPPE